MSRPWAPLSISSSVTAEGASPVTMRTLSSLSRSVWKGTSTSGMAERVMPQAISWSPSSIRA
jgi:hypothetical protein